MKKQMFQVGVVSFVLMVLISAVVWYVTTGRGVVAFNDTVFKASMVLFCIGFIMAIVAKSRQHYYLHLRDKFMGKVEGSEQFESEDERRSRLASIGISIGLSGVVGIALCALLLLLSEF